MATPVNVVQADFSGGFFGRGTPAAHNAERAVLSTMICNSTSLQSGAERLLPEDFDDPRHRTLFEVLRRLHLVEHKAVDANLLADAVKDRIDEVGGAEYLLETVSFAPMVGRLDDYVQLLQEKALLRRMAGVGGELYRMAYSEDNVKDSLAKAEQMVMELGHKFIRGDYRNLGEVMMDDVWTSVADFKENPSDARGTKTGFPLLDWRLGGLKGGDLVILAARPSMGKTAFALNIAQNVAREKPVLVFSLEMSAQQLAFRMLCSEAFVDSKKVQSGKTNDEEWEHLIRSFDRLCNLPIFIDDNPNTTPYDVASRARRLLLKEASETGLGMIVVDYLGLLKPNTRYDSLNQQVSEMSRAMKAVARELDVPMLLLSQLNRELEKTKDKRPQLSHLRDSGAIEQDADIVMFLHRPAYFKQQEGGEAAALEEISSQEEAEIIVAKHRNGPTGVVKLGFQRDRVKFVSIDGGFEED